VISSLENLCWTNSSLDRSLIRSDSILTERDAHSGHENLNRTLSVPLKLLCIVRRGTPHSHCHPTGDRFGGVPTSMPQLAKFARKSFSNSDSVSHMAVAL
jgi:hypothetical protein